jgi:hypothetical protein
MTLVEADELADLGGIIDPARILRHQRLIGGVGRRHRLVADLDRAELVRPAVHRHRIAAELLVLPRDHAEHREIVGNVRVVAGREGRAAQVAQIVILVRGLDPATLLAAERRRDLQVDIARKAAGQIRRRGRLDHRDRREDVRIERAERRGRRVGRASQDRIGESPAVQRGARERARQAAQRDGGVARIRLAVDLHPGYPLDRLADIQVRKAAKAVGRDRIGDLIGFALDVERIGIGPAEPGDHDLVRGPRLLRLRRARLAIGIGVLGERRRRHQDGADRRASK